MSRTNTLNILKLHPLLKVIKRSEFVTLSLVTNLNFNAVKRIDKLIWLFFLAIPHLQTWFVMNCKVSWVSIQKVFVMWLKKGTRGAHFLFLFVLREDWKEIRHKWHSLFKCYCFHSLCQVRLSKCPCVSFMPYEKLGERGLGSSKFCKPEQLCYRLFLKSKTNLSPIAVF